MTDPSNPWLLNVRDPLAGATGDADAPDATPTNEEQLPPDTLGLALSGGGIRSAAFSLGLIQALARNRWLRHVDFLSTVSGGGYTGTFLGRFFDQCIRPGGVAGFHGAIANGAAQARVAQELADPQSPTIRWLRRHANYLSPAGLGEGLFNFATFWRNFASLHFVLGLLFFAIFGLANLVGYNELVARWLAGIYSLGSGLAPLTMALPDTVSRPWATATECVLWLAVVPLCFAYWLGSQDRNREFVVTFFLSCLILSFAALVATRQPVCVAIFAAAIGWTLESWWAVGKREGLNNPNRSWRMALGRNHLTYRLAFWVAAGIALAALTAIDSLGQLLARTLLAGDLTWSATLAWLGSLVGTAAATIPVLHMLAGYLATRENDRGSLLSTIGRIPYLPTLLILALGAFLPLVLISFAAHSVYGLGYTYYAGVGATLVAVVVSLLLGTQESFPFVNRSGPLTIYAARLARVFLGAVNPNRLRHERGGDVSHVIEGDDVAHHQYAPHASGGPLHLFNVAVNETVDVASRRGIRDRQAENMSVGPAGVSISTRWHGLWHRTGRGAPSLKAIYDGTTSHPLQSKSGAPTTVEPLSIRQWMGISGAAVSPGLGRLTGAATALLFTLANLRLGYWWNSGLKFSDRAGMPIKNGLVDRFKSLFSYLLSGQYLLVSELRGRFGGPWRRRWYLSDGGHFENSGVYELLRRRVPYIILCGAGQDRRHEATDIAELSRIARIDFGAEIEEAGDTVQDWMYLGVPQTVAGSLGQLSDLLGTESKLPKKHACLLRITFPHAGDSTAWVGRSICWLLYIKATVTGDEAIDVLNYKKKNADFPNESTLDQFFDERQWESYRKLGDHIGSQMFI